MMTTSMLNMTTIKRNVDLTVLPGHVEAAARAAHRCPEALPADFLAVEVAVVPLYVVDQHRGPDGAHDGRLDPADLLSVNHVGFPRIE